MSGFFQDKGIAIMGPFPPRPGGVSVQCEILAQKLTAVGALVSRINTDIPELRRRKRLGKMLLPFAQVAHLLQGLYRTHRQWQILHVHAASWWGFMPAVVGLVAKPTAKRLVLTYHGGEASLFLKRWGWFARPILKRYDAVLTLTPTQARIFSTHGLETQVVPNVVPIESFYFRSRGPIEPRLLWLRQLEPRYRPEDALRVFALVQQDFPQTTLTMAGSGSLAAELHAHVEAQRLTGVVFTGQLAADAITRAYDSADVFLNTSAVDNLPLTLIEASASGLPIVSTNAGAIPDLIADKETGLLSAVGDVVGLADSIKSLLRNSELARHLSHSAHENARRFSWQNVSPLLASAYALNSTIAS